MSTENGKKDGNAVSLASAAAVAGSTPPAAATPEAAGPASGDGADGTARKGGLPLLAITLFLAGCAAGGALFAALPHIAPGLLG